jgi:hypothetical protein
MVVGVGFCKIKVDSNFLLVLKIKCTKFHQDRSKTVDLHTKYTNKQTFSFIYTYIDGFLFSSHIHIRMFFYNMHGYAATVVRVNLRIDFGASWLDLLSPLWLSISDPSNWIKWLMYSKILSKR